MAVIARTVAPVDLSSRTVAALLAEVRAAERSSSRALVLRADRPVFCSGAALDAVTDWTPRDHARLWELLSALRDSRLVTVAVVDGAAYGGGVGLAAACDLVVAGAGASFRLTEVLVGLVPALIWPFVAARIGHHAMFRSALLATSLDAAGAHRLGLADEVRADPDESVGGLARALRRMPRNSVADLKACRRALTHVPAGYLDQSYGLLRAAVEDDVVLDRIESLRGIRA
ncbi:enoyl-CoA hydratase/isomerase family protein [Actinophytocola gossypii]|uniref:Enoyl-CoA hydratase/isomerase family protein n=1 Tax=Actinophytocola gossypii TaxID=2812003 RepID=A0ABT2J693_9PSEU|nr:enoyl-CoA hydratase/isomerase family protein [Actinophytocola gossypii]MCT2583114.1 enoyl-CoA hydratase/isomerase family protein [Actinophytocola gossypii]